MKPHEAHLWAVAYDNPAQAERARAELVNLAGPGQHLLLLDVATLARALDGSYTINREPFPLTSNILAGGTLGFLAGVALAAPITDAAIGALLGTAASTVANAMGIEGAFIRDVERLMKPGTSALLVLDDQGEMEVILHAIRGWVDIERAKLIQATLSGEPLEPSTPDGKATQDRAPSAHIANDSKW